MFVKVQQHYPPKKAEGNDPETHGSIATHVFEVVSFSVHLVQGDDQVIAYGLTPGNVIAETLVSGPKSDVSIYVMNEDGKTVDSYFWN